MHHLLARFHHLFNFLPIFLVNRSKNIIFFLSWDAQSAIHLFQILAQDHHCDARIFKHNWVFEILKIVQKWNLFRVVRVGWVNNLCLLKHFILHIFVVFHGSWDIFVQPWSLILLERFLPVSRLFVGAIWFLFIGILIFLLVLLFLLSIKVEIVQVVIPLHSSTVSALLSLSAKISIRLLPRLLFIIPGLIFTIALIICLIPLLLSLLRAFPLFLLIVLPLLTLLSSVFIPDHFDYRYFFFLLNRRSLLLIVYFLLFSFFLDKRLSRWSCYVSREHSSGVEEKVQSWMVLVGDIE